MPTRAIVFDLDGTLLDTLQDIATTANQILTRHGFPTHSVERYRQLVGHGLGDLVRRVLPDQSVSDGDVARFIEEYRDLYSRMWRETSRPYPAVPELLRSLTEYGVPMAVLSNKRDDFTRLCVSTFFPDVPFVEVWGEREGVPRKPDPCSALLIAESLGVEPRECFFVGDSEVDMMTAKNAAMRGIGVLWGFRSREVLSESGAEVIVESPDEIMSLVREQN